MSKLKVTKTTTLPPDNSGWGEKDRQQMPAAMQKDYQRIHGEPIEKGTTVSQKHIDSWKNNKNMISTNTWVETKVHSPAEKPAEKPAAKPTKRVGDPYIGGRKTKTKPATEAVETTFSSSQEKVLNGKFGKLKSPKKLTPGRNKFRR